LLSLEDQLLNITELEVLALKICKKLKTGDVIMLKGELGAGKTTLSRFIINNLYLLNNIKKPNLINSPTYPILLTYDLIKYQIYHYDLYRINNVRELEELSFFENIENSITLVEWPEILMDLNIKKNYYLIDLKLYSETKRIINIKCIK
tara:strand:+ start:19 stop:465 length:447 start_codon:yes stop_codon:yes gene_type:complete